MAACQRASGPVSAQLRGLTWRTRGGAARQMLVLLAALVALSGTVYAKRAVEDPGAVTVDQGPNAPEHRGKPYVVLVSIDGFRYDYVRRYGAKNIEALAARGASAREGMLPSYPSLTFPNHYTIVT